MPGEFAVSHAMAAATAAQGLGLGLEEPAGRGKRRPGPQGSGVDETHFLLCRSCVHHRYLRNGPHHLPLEVIPFAICRAPFLVRGFFVFNSTVFGSFLFYSGVV